MITYSSGLLSLAETIEIAYPKEVAKEAELLKEYLFTDFGMEVEIAEDENDADILLFLNSEVKTENSGGYNLEVGKEKFAVTSDSNTGIFNGIQSLRQIIQKKKVNLSFSRVLLKIFLPFHGVHLCSTKDVTLRENK